MILHHWDADGICSAAMYIKINGSDTLFTPKLGNFFIDDEDLAILRNHSQITVLDMNLPDVDKLCSFAKIRIYDHHRTTKVECAEEHYNPYLWGERYPSTTTVLAKRFSYSVDYLVAIGIVGDMGPAAKNIPEWNIVENMVKKGISYDTLVKAAELLDSSYKMGKRDEVIENVHLALQGLDDILHAEHLWQNLDTIQKEVQRWVELADDRGKFFYLKMNTEMNIISAVTRKLAWDGGKTAIVVNTKPDRDEFYIRSPDYEFDATLFIEEAKKRGYKAGGKKEVMGAILPKGEGEKFANYVMEVLI